MAPVEVEAADGGIAEEPVGFSGGIADHELEIGSTPGITMLVVTRISSLSIGKLVEHGLVLIFLTKDPIKSKKNKVKYGKEIAAEENHPAGPYSSFVKDVKLAPPAVYFDYMVIGGGTAGCALAATLSQGGAKVLLLERGVLGGGFTIIVGFFARASSDYVVAAGCNSRLVNELYDWVEKKVVLFQPPVLTWQSTVREGLLAWYNDFTYEHLLGTEVGGTIFD
ncbi:HOTHEAD-like isoform X2 [Olea europaea subsp. europaea]|uniref:HOTHEAD-like isoform X2 n=1 Tax=Olea europaea subsp. europaea TaxID=158383 RepID=A0A8S0Q6S2_OLEEU|nr:HOTHEAD-like isoform X2 [Olea europaea subsp. europaea]